MCCCETRTHVKVISGIGIALSGIVWLIWAFQVSYGQTESLDHSHGNYNTQNFSEEYSSSHGGETAVLYLWSTTSLLANILCLIGALKSIKALLVPYMIATTLWIVLLVVGISLILAFGSMITGSSIIEAIEKEKNVLGQGTHWLGLGFGMFAFLLLVPTGAALGLCIYFLVIVVKFYKELSRVRILNMPNDTALQQLDSRQYYTQQRPPIPSNYVPYIYQQDNNIPYSYEQQQTNMAVRQSEMHTLSRY